VTQQLLKLPEVHLAAMQQMGGYAVAQDMGGELRSNIGLPAVSLQDKPEPLPGEPLPPAVEE